MNKIIYIAYTVLFLLLFSSCSEDRKVIYIDINEISQNYFSANGTQVVLDMKTKRFNDSTDSLYQQIRHLENNDQLDQIAINNCLLEIDQLEKSFEKFELAIMVSSSTKIAEFIDIYCLENNIDLALSNLDDGVVIFKSETIDENRKDLCIY